MLFNKRRYTLNASKKVLHKIKKRWVVISLALLGLISGVALTTAPINVNADNHNPSASITQRADQLHSQLINNSAQSTRPIMHLGAESNNSTWNFPSDVTSNYSDYSTTSYTNSDNLDSNYTSNLSDGVNYSDNSDYSNPFTSLSDNYIDDAYQLPSYSDNVNNYSDSSITNYSDNYDYITPSYSDYSDNLFNNYNLVSSSDNNWNITSDVTSSSTSDLGLNNYSDIYSDYSSSDWSNSNSFYNYSDLSASNNTSDIYALSDNTLSSSLDNVSNNYSDNSISYSYSDGTNSDNYFSDSVDSASNIPSDSDALSSYSDSFVVSSNTAVPNFSDNSVASSVSGLTSESSYYIEPSSSSSTVSDTTSDNVSNNFISDAPTVNVDATHKYLIPDKNGKYITFNSDSFSDVKNHELDYQSDFKSLYSDAKFNNVPLVHIVSTKNLLGYNLDEISDAQPSDSDTISDAWVFSDELNDSNFIKSSDNDFNSFNNTLNSGYGTDATHKYLISGTNNQNVTFGFISSDGSYSDYNDSDNQSPSFVKIVNNKTVFGYHFDQIIINSDNASDSSDADKEWVFADELNNSPKNHVNDIQELQGFKQTVMNHYYTPTEINRINGIKQRYNYLKQNEDNSNNIYVIKPDLPNHRVGQLTNKFRRDVTDWVNFYRNLYGLSSVDDNSNYDLQAQYGADGCNSINKIEHGLNGMSSKPSNVTSSDWQKGINATNSSNLYGGGASDPSEIQGYFDDGANLTGNNTGHRAWLLDQGLHNIGVGVDNGYGDLYVITPSDSSITSSDETNPSFKDIAFPNAVVFPYSDAVSGPWSLYLPGVSDVSNSVKVSVHDDTTNVNLSVNDIELSSDYGYYNGIITYEPQNIKVNHQYTITITGQGIPNGKYTYTTKLFNLDY